MPKKTTILIVILAIITGILIFVAVRSDQTQELGRRLINNNTSPTEKVVKPYASLSFSKSLLDVSKSTPNQKIDIILDTNGKQVAGAQVELTYDPKVLTNVSLTPLVPNQLFGKNPVVLISSVDQAQGRISYAIAISSNDTEKSGIGSIGAISFTVNKFSGQQSTQVTFLPKSAVTTFETKVSVLDKALPLQIVLTPSSAISPTQ